METILVGVRVFGVFRGLPRLLRSLLLIIPFSLCTRPSAVKLGFPICGRPRICGEHFLSTASRFPCFAMVIVPADLLTTGRERAQSTDKHWPRQRRHAVNQRNKNQEKITMNVKRLLMLSGLAVVLGTGAGRLAAQGGPQGGFGGPGGFDPAQIQKMILDNTREALEVKDDDEWKVIGDQVQKVMDARMQVGMGGGSMGRLFRRGGGGGGNADAGNGPGGGGGRRAFFNQSSPESDALQQAIDRKATNAELKEAVAKYIEARKQKQAKLEQAQAELRKLLSVRQEAIAFSLGLL